MVGSINADLTTHVQRHPNPGETLLGSGGTVSAGGKGANQAVAAAQLGTNVTGAIGNDAMDKDSMVHLEKSGVDTAPVATIDGSTGLAVITVSADGENTIIVVPGANAQVDAGFVEKHAELIKSAGIMLLQGEIPASGFARAVDLAQGRVVVNLAPVVEVGHEQLLKANTLVVNESETGSSFPVTL